MTRKKALRARLTRVINAGRTDAEVDGIDPKTGRLKPGFRYVKGGGVVKVGG